MTLVKLIQCAGLAISLTASAQDFGEEPGKLKLSPEWNVLKKHAVGGDASELIEINSDRKFNVNVPIDTPEVNRAKIAKLVGQIRDICPTCSNVGTVGGTVITGGNVNPSEDAGLWPVDGTYVRIKRAEYETLKKKAALYDQLKPDHK